MTGQEVRDAVCADPACEFRAQNPGLVTIAAQAIDAATDLVKKLTAANETVELLKGRLCRAMECQDRYGRIDSHLNDDPWCPIHGDGRWDKPF